MATSCCPKKFIDTWRRSPLSKGHKGYNQALSKKSSVSQLIRKYRTRTARHSCRTKTLPCRREKDGLRFFEEGFGCFFWAGATVLTFVFQLVFHPNSRISRRQRPSSGSNRKSNMPCHRTSNISRWVSISSSMGSHSSSPTIRISTRSNQSTVSILGTQVAGPKGNPAMTGVNGFSVFGQKGAIRQKGQQNGLPRNIRNSPCLCSTNTDVTCRGTPPSRGACAFFR